MRRLFTATAALIILVVIVSCGGKKEAIRTSEDSRIATEAFKVVEDIKEAYLKKDVQTIERNTTREGFKVISQTVRRFDSASLNFNPVWTEIEQDGTVNLNVSWTGTWKRGSSTFDERGMAVFVLKGRPLKVDAIVRENPFRYPE
ncbi:MAG: hypothetical protein AB1553_03505 [Nitrospirota bacterium]